MPRVNHQKRSAIMGKSDVQIEDCSGLTAREKPLFSGSRRAMAPGAEGVVFNIQRFSLHDGAGIRTLVFLKGCPLRCLWCANPEGQSGATEIRYDKNGCIGCGACIDSCPEGAVSQEPATGFTISKASCRACGACVRACPSGAKSEWGETRDADEIVDIVKRDSLFYRHSGGGVTIGGGEVLFQPAFACEVLRKCRELGLNTAIETSGYGDWPWLERIAEYCDTIFYDLKIVDRHEHRRITGVDNETILDNLRALDEMLVSRGTDRPLHLIVRVPVIPEVNADTENMAAIGTFIRSELHNTSTVELMPFHNLCEQKYEQLGRPYLLKGRAGLMPEKVEPLKKTLTDMGLNCTIMSW